MTLFTHRRSPESMRVLYNWFHHLYGLIENHLKKDIERAVIRHVDPINGRQHQDAIEYACGSGLLTRMLCERFETVTAVDQSEGMLKRASRRCKDLPSPPVLRHGNILEVSDAPDSADWAFISFALHLFSTEDQIRILRNMLRVSRKGVIVIDHVRRWQPLTALAEWAEGSHYDQYLQADFASVAAQIGAAHFVEHKEPNLCVLIFSR